MAGSIKLAQEHDVWIVIYGFENNKVIPHLDVLNTQNVSLLAN